MTLRLVLTDALSSSSWTWELRNGTGAVLARQRVNVEPDDPSLAIVDDLYRNLWRISSGPRQPFLDRMGEFIRERLLGAAGRVLAEQAPVTVHVDLGAMTSLLKIPFELARLGAVTFCYTVGDGAPPPAHPGRPRVLAVFALPGESSALALSRERRALRARFAAYGDAVELSTLQYGVTRQVLLEALDDPAGWDVVHVAGHGRAGRLFLEKDDDGRDPVTAAEFTTMLAGGRRPPGLVVLSTCESGAVRVLRRRRGAEPTELAQRAGSELAEGTENLAYQIAGRLGCAVVAMRYPVDDDFSVAFNERLYDGLLVDALPVDQVLRAAVPAAAAGQAALSEATPMMFGDPSFQLLPDRPISIAADPRGSSVRQPDRFVGRTAVMARLVHATATAVLLTGMPGVGKTTCLAEAAVWHHHRGRDVIKHRVRADETADSLLAVLGAGVRDRDVLVILDDIDTAPQVADVVAWLCAPGARATVLMAARRPVPVSAAVTTVVPLLTRTESELLAREVEEQAQIDARETAGPDPSNAWPWQVGRGLPALIDSRSTGHQEARAWEVFTPVPTGRPTLAAGHPGRLVEEWAAETAVSLTPSARLLWQFLSSLEGLDRHKDHVAMLWPLVCAERGQIATPLDTTLAELTRRGVAQHWDHGRFLLHPAVVRAGRDDDPDTEQLTVGLLAAVWGNRYETWSQADALDEDNLGNAAASSVPYLMRLRRWVPASTRAEEAIHHDRSPSMAARLLPFLNEIIRAQPDPHLRRASRFVRASILSDLDPVRSRKELETVFNEASDADDKRTQVAAAVGIASQLIQQRSMEASAWLRRATDVSDGDLSTVPLIRLKYAKLADHLGDHTTALQQAEEVLADLASQDLADEPGEDSLRVNLNSVRLEALHLAAAAADNLGDQPRADRLRDEIDRELDRQGASDRARSIAQFNRLTGAGSTDDASAGLLVAARAEFGNPADQQDAALVTMRLADLDRHRHNDREAVELARTALQAAYAGGDLWTTAGIHEDLAELLARLPEPDRQEIATHLLASAVIGLRAAGLMLALHRPPQLERAQMMLTFLLARRPGDPPRSLPELAQELTASAGVDLRALLNGTDRVAITVDPDGGTKLSTGDGPGDSVTDALTFATHWPPPEELTDPRAHPEHWQPIKELFNAPQPPADQRQTVLDRLRATGWNALANALEHPSHKNDPDAAVLDPIDCAVLDMLSAT